MLTPIIVSRVGNEDEQGVMVSQQLLKNPETQEMDCVAGVCWFENRSPAISFHSITELEWITIPGVTDDEDEDDDDDLEDEVEESLEEHPEQ